jgi:D-alanine-D-alanine ligase-like ATP-grasp enzyme
MSFVVKDAAGSWSLTKTGSIIVAGIANGLFFWALHSLAFFQGAGFFGNALAGALALMGYAVVVQPLMGSLSKVAA